MTTYFWMRTRARHTPAHGVRDWDDRTRQVTTVCGWHPSPGGHLVDRGELVELEAYRCVLCARAARRPQ